MRFFVSGFRDYGPVHRTSAKVDGRSFFREYYGFMFCAYILQSVDHPSEFYRGHTSNLNQGLADRNAGHCSHTSKFGPWKLKFYAAFETVEQAVGFERYLKTGCGNEFATRTVTESPLLTVAPSRYGVFSAIQQV
jgi:predicted GIY-YIG superfamily endonuclease